MNRRPVQWLFAVLGLSVFFGGLALLRSWGENWNATPTETHQTLAGDDILPNAQRTTMAITVHAPAAQIWPRVGTNGRGARRPGSSGP